MSGTAGTGCGRCGTVYRNQLEVIQHFCKGPTPGSNPVRDALAELVSLRLLKEKNGKTPEYHRRMPIAWQRAKAALEL